MKLDIKDMLGPLITGAVLTFGVIQYKATSYDEFVKPVREAQLKVYQETSDTAALIAVLPKGSPQQEESRRDFLRLYYGPLTMLEDFAHGPAKDLKPDQAEIEHPPDYIPTVEEAATVFKICIERQDCRDDIEAIRKLARALAYTCRESLRKSWRYEVRGFRDDHKKVILDHEIRFQKTAS